MNADSPPIAARDAEHPFAVGNGLRGPHGQVPVQRYDGDGMPMNYGHAGARSPTVSPGFQTPAAISDDIAETFVFL